MKKKLYIGAPVMLKHCLNDNLNGMTGFIVFKGSDRLFRVKLNNGERVEVHETKLIKLEGTGSWQTIYIHTGWIPEGLDLSKELK